MSISRVLIATLATACLFAALPTHSQSPELDLALVLAIDTSSSVDEQEYRLQMDGLAKALASKDVLDAIHSGPNRRISITIFEWSDDTKHLVVVPWAVISNRAEASAVARLIKARTRSIVEGGTSIGGAMHFGEQVLATAPVALRRAIDISTDGHNNFGPPVEPIRQRLVADGVVINALVILNEFPDLRKYATDRIIGGDGSFVMPADSYANYEKAIRLKLIREVTGSSLS